MFTKRIMKNAKGELKRFDILNENLKEVYSDYKDEGIQQKKYYNDQGQIMKVTASDGYICDYIYKENSCIEKDNRGNEQECILMGKGSKIDKISKTTGKRYELYTNDQGNPTKLKVDGDLMINNIYQEDKLTKTINPLNGEVYNYEYIEISDKEVEKIMNGGF